MAPSIPDYGKRVNRFREGTRIKISRMSKKAKPASAVLWENTRELMREYWGEINLYKLAKDAKIGTGGASRLKAQKSGTRLPTIEKIAALWKDRGVEPWMLLYPELDPANLPVVLSDDEKKLYARLKRAKAVADGEAQPEAPEAVKAT
jgi:hypothetical protein